MQDNVTNFLNHLSKVTSRIRKELVDGSIAIVSHYDADGLSSASILAKAFESHDLTYHLRIVDQLDHEVVTELSSLGYDIMIFSDMGSGQVDLVERCARRGTKVIILDHHLPLRFPSNNTVIDLNPHHYGIDGGVEVSSSTLSYLFVKSLGLGSPYLTTLAIVGALGDRQDVAKMRSLTGLNKLVLEEGISSGVISVEIGLRLFGLRSRPLVKCLEYSMDPFLPGLTGRESAVILFLKRIGIEPVEDGRLRTYSSLTQEERRKLATELVKYLINIGYSARQAEEIFGTLYFLANEDPSTPLYEGREYATLLNACGRLNRHEIAIALGLGLRGKYLQEALRILNEYKRIIGNFLAKLQKGGNYVKEYDGGKLTVIDCREEVPTRAIGALASILASSKFLKAKGPIIVVGGGERIKVSARLPLSFKGEVNLGILLTEAAKSVGGVGGGHTKAAGAIVKRNKLTAFLRKLLELLPNS